MHQLEETKSHWTTKSNFKRIKNNYAHLWRTLFDFVDLADPVAFTQPLTPAILSNPSHQITQHLLYLYSMESFVYSELNRASREKDKSKI